MPENEYREALRILAQLEKVMEGEGRQRNNTEHCLIRHFHKHPKHLTAFPPYSINNDTLLYSSSIPQIVHHAYLHLHCYHKQPILIIAMKSLKFHCYPSYNIAPVAVQQQCLIWQGSLLIPMLLVRAHSSTAHYITFQHKNATSLNVDTRDMY